MIGWFRSENGVIVTAAVIAQLTKDTILVEDVTNVAKRYEIHRRYFNVTPMLHGNA